MAGTVLQDLEDAIQDARAAAAEIKEQKLAERISHIESRHRDLVTQLQPFLNLLARGRNGI